MPAYRCVGVVFVCSYLFCLSLFPQHAAQYHLHLVTARHDWIPSQTFEYPSCAVMCRGAALDMTEIPEYVSTLQAEGTFDRCRGRRGCMSFEPWGTRCLL